ncbi:MAG: hypothetical protein ACI3YH_09040, partial [Eubacteriales bacterium]
DGSIHLNLAKELSAEGTLLFTAAHELTHYIRDYAPDKFGVLADFLMEQYGEHGVSVSELVERQMEIAETDGRQIDYDTAFEEVIASSMETMLQSGNVVEAVAKLRAKDATLWEKFAEYFRDLANRLRKAFQGLSPTSREGRYVGAMKDAAERLEELFTDALVTASGREQTKNTAEGGVRYSDKSSRANFVADKYFETQMAKWDHLTHGSYVRVGNISESHPLHLVGMPSGVLRYDVDKLKKNMLDHGDYLTIELLRKIPDIIANPMAISEYSKENTVSVFGNIFVGNSPMMVGVTISKDRAGNDISKVRTYNTRRDVGRLITDDSVLYINEDKKRTQEWFQACGIQVPLGGTKLGFIRSISQTFDSVNRKFSVSVDNFKYSERDSAYMEAVESGDMITAQRLVDEAAKEAGYKTTLLHGTTKKFTSFENLGAHTQAKSAYLGVWLSDSESTARAYSTPQISDYDESSIGVWDSLYNKAKEVESEIREAVGENDYFRISNYYWNMEIIGAAFKEYLPQEYKELLELGVFRDGEKYVPLTKSTYSDNIKIFDDVRRRVNEMKKWLDDLLGINNWGFNFRSDIIDMIGSGVIRKFASGEIAPRILRLYVNTDNFTVAQQPFRKDEQKVSKIKSAKKRGKDGVVFYDMRDGGAMSNHYIVFDPTNIKSADPVTYDDSGNVIPLSERFNSKKNDIRYSTDSTDVATLQADNAALRADNARLVQLLSLQRTAAGGTRFTEESVSAAADSLMKWAGANGNRGELIEMLHSLYEYIAGGQNVDWDTIRQRSEPIVDWLADHRKSAVETDPQVQDLKRYLRPLKVKLSDAQMRQVEALYGSYNEYRKKLFGTVNLSKDAGVTLDEVWSEMADKAVRSAQKHFVQTVDGIPERIPSRRCGEGKLKNTGQGHYLSCVFVIKPKYFTVKKQQGVRL